MKFRLFVIRLRVAFEILFQIRRSWFVVSISKEQLANVFKGEDYEPEISFHKLQPYVVNLIIQQLSSGLDDIDMLQERLRFELKAEEFKKSK